MSIIKRRRRNRTTLERATELAKKWPHPAEQVERLLQLVDHDQRRAEEVLTRCANGVMTLGTYLTASEKLRASQ